MSWGIKEEVVYSLVFAPIMIMFDNIVLEEVLHVKGRVVNILHCTMLCESILSIHVEMTGVTDEANGYPSNY